MIFFGKSISLLVYKLGGASRLPNAMIKDRTEQRLPNTAAIHGMMAMIWESVLAQSGKKPERKRLEKSSNVILGKGKIKRVSWQKTEEKGAYRERESR